jgi:8-oxo-dGTP pyrophosphatase MutT (NUDIX family)
LRELEEETQISLTEDDLIMMTIDHSTGTDGNKYTTYIYAAFLDEKPSVVLSNEFVDHVWLQPDDHRLLHRQSAILTEFIHQYEMQFLRDLSPGRTHM